MLNRGSKSCSLQSVGVQKMCAQMSLGWGVSHIITFIDYQMLPVFASFLITAMFFAVLRNFQQIYIASRHKRVCHRWQRFHPTISWREGRRKDSKSSRLETCTAFGPYVLIWSNVATLLPPVPILIPFLSFLVFIYILQGEYIFSVFFFSLGQLSLLFATFWS